MGCAFLKSLYASLPFVSSQVSNVVCKGRLPFQYSSVCELPLEAMIARICVKVRETSNGFQPEQSKRNDKDWLKWQNMAQGKLLLDGTPGCSNAAWCAWCWCVCCNGGGVKCRVVKSEGSKSLSEQTYASWQISLRNKQKRLAIADAIQLTSTLKWLDRFWRDFTCARYFGGMELNARFATGKRQSMR